MNRLPRTLAALALVGSLTLNVAIMTRYRVPGFLWESSFEEQYPEIPLSRIYPDGPPPKLRFSGTTRSAAEFPAWQERATAILRERLGIRLPDEVPPARLVRTDTVGEIRRDTLVLTANDGVEIPGYLFIPPGASPRPAIVSLPAWSIGIVGSAGLTNDFQHSMALRIAEAGYVVLTLEHRGLGYLQRLGPPGHDMDFWPHVGYLLMYGGSLPGRLVADAVSGLNYLETRPEVDGERMGAVGLSLGGKIAIYLAALDDRIRAVVASGSVMSYRENFRYALHGPEDAIPGLANWLDFGDVMGTVAPRPMLVHWGELDNDRSGRSAAYNEGSIEAFDTAKRIYLAAGAADLLTQHVTLGMEHEFDIEPVRSFLADWLPTE